MKIKEIWLNSMNTITMKVFGALILLDICMLWYYYLLLYALYPYSILICVCLKLFFVAIVYLSERGTLEQNIELEPPSKFWLVIESISIVIQLLVLIFSIIYFLIELF